MLNVIRVAEALRQALEETPAVTKATPKRRVEILPHPDEEAETRRSAGEVWGHLSGWAGHYGVSADQALLVCACTAAHAAGPGLEFEGSEGSRHRKYPAPTLIAATEDIGFHLAISGALHPLREIEQELIGKYKVAHGRKTKPSMEEIREEWRRENLRHYELFQGGDYARLNAEEQAEGVVRFILDGKPPAKPHRVLEACHLHAALASLRVERLPLTTRAREKRMDAIAPMHSGYWRGNVWIRGFVRFDQDDLEWVLSSTRCLRMTTLPLVGAEESVPDAPLRDEGDKHEFDCIHEAAMREVLRLRFGRAELGMDFSDGEAARHFGMLRAAYRLEM